MDIEGKKLPETQQPVVNSVLETKTGESFGKEKGLGWGEHQGPGLTLSGATGHLSLDSWPGWAEVHVCLFNGIRIRKF